MGIVQLARAVNIRFDVLPDVVVDGFLGAARSLSDRVDEHYLGMVNVGRIEGESLTSLFEELIRYTVMEQGVVKHKLEFNESLRDSDELSELYDPKLHGRPENNLRNWTALSKNLDELRGHSSQLSFDTKFRQFSLGEGIKDTRVKSLIEKVNTQLEYTSDLTVISDPGHIVESLTGREDYVGKRLAPSFLRSESVRDDLVESLRSGNFLVVGPNNVRLGGKNPNSALNSYFDYFTTPTLEELVVRQREALEQDKEVAVASQIGIDTARGNLRGAKNVVKYVSTAYFLVNSAILAAQSAGVDINPDIVKKLNLAAIVAASYIPSYNEVAEIAGGINVEQIARMRFAYSVGREKGDLSMYRRMAATLSSEQTFQQYQIDGWIGASAHTLYEALAGNLDDPAIFAITMSLQVSANNWLGSIAMWLENHYSNFLRERKREWVKEHPESIRYFGIDAVVSPGASDEYQDLNKLNPEIVKYLSKDGAVSSEEKVPEGLTKIRDEIRQEVNERVEAYMEEFGKLNKGQKQRKIIRLVLEDQGKRLTHAFSDKFGRNGQDSDEKVRNGVGRPGLEYRLNAAIDIPRSIGLPVPIPYKDARVPEGSFFNRSFPFYNVAVPLGFLGMFAAIGGSEFSPVKIVTETDITNLWDILYVAGVGVALQGVYTAVGAADTAGAALSAAWEVIADSTRKAKKSLLGDHAETTYHAISGKGEARSYEIPIEGTSGSYERILDLLRGSGFKSVNTKVVRDTEDSFRYDFTLKNGLRRSSLVSAMKLPGEDIARLYSSKDLGKDFLQYASKPLK